MPLFANSFNSLSLFINYLSTLINQLYYQLTFFRPSRPTYTHYIFFTLVLSHLFSLYKELISLHVRIEIGCSVSIFIFIIFVHSSLRIFFLSFISFPLPFHRYILFTHLVFFFLFFCFLHSFLLYSYLYFFFSPVGLK